MPAETTSYHGNIVDTFARRIFAGSVHVSAGQIVSITAQGDTPAPELPFILPGFVDSHVHIESSMLIPSEFARLAVVHGTVATVSDPHEIANVCGQAGIDFMISNGREVPFKFFFGAPSCVPATPFETAGATISLNDIRQMMSGNDIRYLSEMMNFPAVIAGEGSVREKINAALAAGKPVDGHAPGLRGEGLRKYAAAGISTDHESYTAAEAAEKISLGMKVIIREGSAARNFDALIGLLHHHPDSIMFCSDDKHPDSLVEGHINDLCRRAVHRGIDLFHVLRAACVNPVLHYGLPVGLLRVNDPADFVIVEDLSAFKVLSTYIDGIAVSDAGNTLISPVRATPINQFECSEVSVQDLAAPRTAHLVNGKLPVIEALDGQLVTSKGWYTLKADDGPNINSDPANDILKLVVVNRYRKSPPAIAFIRNFGLRAGAIASSVAHDSHNIIAVGADDASLCEAINLIVRSSGGISCVKESVTRLLPLPVAGLMSIDDGYAVARAYTEMDQLAKGLGSELSAPFMTLSFMALLVIPSLKLSDRGLFDGDAFRFLHGDIPPFSGNSAANA